MSHQSNSTVISVDDNVQTPPSPPDSSTVSDAVTTREMVAEILKLGLPLNVSQLAQFSIVTIMMSTIGGQLGTNALGGASLAMGMMNATGYAFGAGLCGALETLLSHTFGHNPTSKLYGTHTQRMILLQLFVSIPLGYVVANVGSLLEYMGQTAEVVQYTTAFTRISIWGLVPFMLLEVNRRYFAAQHLSTPLTVSICTAAIVNALAQPIAVDWLGFDGPPIVWCVLLVGMHAGLIAYLVVSKVYQNTWGGWNRDALRLWGPMCKLAIPSLGMTACEWAALELNSVFAGFAPPVDLAAFAITVQGVIAMWTIPSGIYIAMSVIVGNKIGEGRPLLSRRFAFTGVATVAAIAVMDVSIFLLLGERWARFYTSDDIVVQRFMSFRWWAALFHFGDSFQSLMLGVLRGMGMPVRGAIGVGMAFGVVGVPLGLSLFLSGTMGVEALWVGPFVGLYVVGAPVYLHALLRTDWAVLKAQGEHIPPELEEEEVTELHSQS